MLKVTMKKGKIIFQVFLSKVVAWTFSLIAKLVLVMEYYFFIQQDVGSFFNKNIFLFRESKELIFNIKEKLREQGKFTMF